MENQIVIFKDGALELDVKITPELDTVWLTQAQMVELFNKNISTISRHINNIFNESEVERKSNLRFMQIANSDKPVAFYSLDVIISVGYRVKSKRGIAFRKWASKIGMCVTQKWEADYQRKHAGSNHTIDSGI